MHTFGLGKKVRHWNCADKYTICILIELSDLKGYDLIDTQDGLRCWRNGIYIFVVNILSLWQGFRWAAKDPLVASNMMHLTGG